MSARPSKHVPTVVRWCGRAAGPAVAGIGGAVLVGWAADIALLKSVVPGLVTMKANAALAFVLSGVALWLLDGPEDGSRQRPERTTARVLGTLSAGAVAFVGLATLAEYFLGWGSGLDTLLWHDPPDAPGTVHPGRMAPSAALAFAVSGVAVLVRKRPWGPSVSQGLAAVAGFVAVLGAVGYILGTEAFTGPADASRIPVHSVAGFLLLSVGIFLSRIEEGWAAILIEDGIGGRTLRQLLPASALVPVVLGLVLQRGQEAGLYPPEVTLPTFVTATVAVAAVLAWLHALHLDRAEGERVEAEAALHESERRKAAVIDASMDCVITADHRGRILDFNPAAERTFGLSRDAAIGREIADVLVPERLRERHRAGLTRFLQTGEARVLGRRIELAALHADGHEFPVELAINAIGVQGGVIFTASVRDITDRKRSEERLRASLAEKEVLLRELHHRVKNNLQVISSLLNLEARRATEGADTRAFERTTRRVRSIAILHERLYRSDDLANVDLEDYLRDVAAAARRAVNPRAPAVETEIDGSGVRQGLDWVVPCGLIVNELVSNALVHGRATDDDPPRVRLGVRIGPKNARIRVDDDGTGFDDPVGASDREDALGLSLVSALARQLRGAVERKRSPELGGARVEVTFPSPRREGTELRSDGGGDPAAPETAR